MTPTIEHRVDVIEVDGAVEQVYNHLIYRWESIAVTARAYFDEINVVSILTGEPTAEVLVYLRERYGCIQRLGRDGYIIVSNQ
jgi:hypothetical protein